MNKKLITIIGSGFLVASLAFAGTGFSELNDSDVRGGTIQLDKQIKADFPASARQTFDRAVAKAINAVQGKVLKAELENENGFLVYGVEIVKADKTIMDVKVDAGSGKILAINRHKMDDEDNESCQHDGDLERED